jgi:enoyl-CoA hydratase
LSSRVVSPQDLVQHGLIDALASKEQILENAIAAVRDLASQPAFEVVKKQVRGGLAADVQGLAVAGADPPAFVWVKYENRMPSGPGLFAAFQDSG